MLYWAKERAWIISQTQTVWTGNMSDHRMMSFLKNKSSASAYLKSQTLLLLLTLLMSSCNSTGNPDLVLKNILFIGNSYTDFNKGLDYQLLKFAPNSDMVRISPGGYTLQNHWEDANTLGVIRSKQWDVIILQEQSQTPVTNYNGFAEYVQKLNAEIKATGAETILFMTWERPDSIQYGVTTQALSNNYTYLGQQLGIKVAPVGLAFANALRERPDLVLYSSDGHPTLQGTYLTAAVFFKVIYGQSPVGINYTAGMSDEDALFLQTIATQTLEK